MDECILPCKPGWHCTRGFHVMGPCEWKRDPDPTSPLAVARSMSGAPLTLTERLQGSLSQALHDHDGATPSRWSLVCETMEADGSIKVFTESSDGLAAWEVLGMYAYAAQIIQARVISAQIGEGNE